VELDDIEYSKVVPTIEEFFNHLNKYFPTDEKTWALHYFRIHVPQYIDYWYPKLGWGYGMFCMQGPEHTNKVVKMKILQHTNGHHDKLVQAMKQITLAQHHFPDELHCAGKTARKLKKCGSCGNPGHMRTNKNCPNYRKRPISSEVLTQSSQILVPGSQTLPIDQITGMQTLDGPFDDEIFLNQILSLSDE